jgi:hypothetical protein
MLFDYDLSRFERFLKRVKERAPHAPRLILVALVVVLLTLTGLSLWMISWSHRYPLIFCGIAIALCVIYAFIYYKYGQLRNQYVSGLIEYRIFQLYAYFEPVFPWHAYVAVGLLAAACFVMVFQAASALVPVQFVRTTHGVSPGWRDWVLFGADNVLNALLLGSPEDMGTQLSSLKAVGTWGRGLLLAFRLIVDYYLILAVKERYDLYKTTRTYVRALAVDTVEAMGRLERLGRRSVPQLLRELKRKNPETLWAAATALGSIGDKRAVKPLIRALEHSNDSFAQRKIIEALTAIGGKDAVAGIQTVVDNAAAELRAGALTHLAVLDVEEARDDFLAGLDDPDSEVRGAALGSLVHMARDGRITPPEMERIAILVDDPSSSVRFRALRALAELYGKSAIPVIEKALDDPVGLVRGAAIDVLSDLGAFG